MIEELTKILSRNDLSDDIRESLQSIIDHSEKYERKKFQETANKFPIPIMMFQRDIDNKITLNFANEAMEELTRGFYKDKIGKTPQEIFKGRLPEILPSIETVLETGNIVQEKGIWTVSNSGEKRWFKVDNVKIADNTVIVIAYDIHKEMIIQKELEERELQYKTLYERTKEAENALKLSEQEYRTLFDKSPISLWEEDFSEIKKYFDQLKGEGISNLRQYLDDRPEELEKLIKLVKIVNINEASLSLYNADNKEEVLKGLTVLFDENTRLPFKEEMVSLFNGAIEFQMNFPGQTITGEPIDTLVKLSIPKGFENSLRKVFISVIDITELKKVEERFRRLFEFSPVAMWEEDLSKFFDYFKNLKNQGITNFQKYFSDHPEEAQKLPLLIELLDVNKACLNLYGATNKQHLIESIDKVYGKDSLPVFIDAAIQLACGEKIVERENVNYNITTGKKLYVNFRSTVITDQHGKKSRGIVAIINISERKKVEKIRAEINERRENFIHMTSHELRTPLTVSKGYSGFLLANYEVLKSEKIEKGIQIIDNNLNRLERLIGGFNNVIQIQRGILEIHKSEFCILEELNDIFHLYKDRLGDKFAIIIETKNDTLPFIGDKDRVREVFENLIENAIKHTDSDKTKITASYKIKSNEIVIKIVDNGAGIDPINLERIFNQFVSIPTKYSVTGTGIGLYLAKWIVEKHRGTIVAESDGIGKGSSFIVTLPLQ